MATKRELIFLQLFHTLLRISSAAGGPVVGVYWGQNTNESTLAELCATAKYSYVNIGFLTTFGGGQAPELNLAGHCDPRAANSCRSLGDEIQSCQNRDVTVMLSLGGAGGNYTLSTTEDAQNLSVYLWNNFLGGGGSRSRPLGDAVLDGIDLVIEGGSPSPYYADLVKFLKSYSNNGREVRISGAPRCLFPDSYLGDALSTRLFDYVWVQFYNNPRCDYSSGRADNLLNSWEQWTTLVECGKIFLCLPAAPEAVAGGFIPPEVLKVKILPAVQRSEKYVGLMLWSAYYDEQNGYSATIVESKTVKKDALAARPIEYTTRRRARGIEYKAAPAPSPTISGIVSKNASARPLIVFGNNSAPRPNYPTQTNGRGNGEVIYPPSGFNASVSSPGKGHQSHMQQFLKQTTVPLLDHITYRQSLNIFLGVALGVAGLAVASIIMYCLFKRRRSPSGKEAYQDVENILLQHGSLAPKRYKYSEIKKIMKSFSEKLGQGGYGNVYKGMLNDGTLVAVKVLSETDSNGEEFINEVASISRTSHVNIVNLLGFCLDRNKRALIYEYMPNKSLDRFISSKANCQLDLNTLYQIALGVAKGLEYLHSGCNTRIVHFDIKPQNILLDEDFCPKISDFGLAKLCKKKQSIVSMLGARGTIGYIAPEIFSRNLGGASHKSDVYSYGMMILEMAGARKMEEAQTTNSSESYFPDKSYEQILVLNATKKLDDAMDEEDEEKARKMFLVGFWCIQTTPSDRPTISKVVEMLEGSIQSLQIPPKPILFCPNNQSGQEISPSFSEYVETESSAKDTVEA